MLTNRLSPALLLTLLTCACETPGKPYLGEQPPGDQPALFAPGLVSTDAAIELNGVFGAGSREFYFTRRIDGVFVMYRMTRDGAEWSTPEALDLYPDGQHATAVDMTCSMDGERLYFLGMARSELTPDEPGLDLWVSERDSENDTWGTARVLPEPVNSSAGEFYPCVVGDGSLYFSSSREGSLGKSDIWRAQALPDGTFAEPVNLGAPINTIHSEGDTYVAPDESYLIVTARRPDQLGGGDLYVSFRTADGGWSEPRHLGDAINTEHTDFCPMVTPDGRYLFFSRRRSDPPGSGWDGVQAGDVYWVRTWFLDETPLD